jgi:hypothetical protein
MMKFNLAHGLSKESARARLETLFGIWQSKYGVNVAWTGDSARLFGTVKGVSFDATLTVGERGIDATGPDPGFVMRAAVTAYLKRKLGEFLDPRKLDADIGKIET